MVLLGVVVLAGWHVAHGLCVLLSEQALCRCAWLPLIVPLHRLEATGLRQIFLLLRMTVLDSYGLFLDITFCRSAEIEVQSV